MPGAASAAGRGRPAACRTRGIARTARHGLAGVLAGPDPAPEWRAPWRRRAAFGGLAAATLALSAASLADLPPAALFPSLPRDGLLPALFRLRSRYALTPHPGAGHRAVGFSTPAKVPLVLFHHPIWWLMPAGSATTVLLVALVALAVIAPLPLVVRYPLLGWRIGWLALLGVPLLGIYWQGNWPWDPVQLLALAVVFCVAGARHQRPVLCWMWVLTLAGLWLQAGQDDLGVTGCVLGTIALSVAAIAADAVSSRRRAQQALAGQAERTELEAARRAVLEERARIAREMHDVVAHHMSLIAVRAETAPYRLAGLSGPVREEFGSLSGAAREALADMRRLLGVLRHDQEPAGRAPVPQLADLPALVEGARRAGVPVELSASTLDQVPSGVGVCAYRIVQESLSNAGRHAPGAAVTVSVGHDAGAVVLRVANGPAMTTALPGPPGNGHRPGHGLAGMRERVVLIGGSLTAGPSPDGGFVVSAVLPLGAAA
jgi:signal transduction histidine kinase